MKFKIALVFIGLLFLATSTTFAQATMTPEQEAAYTKTINERAAKIVAGMSVTDEAKAKKVTSLIANQYRDLNNIYVARDIKKKEIKEKNADNKEVLDAQLKTLEEDVNAQLDKLHTAYLAKLSKELTPAQVDEVKNGMTYNVLNVTYKAYQSQLPQLTEEQKTQILAWLTEAREHAMDAESSEKKHAWFGKYKGRINNYLSKAGIDMKKAGEEWQKRLKAEAEAKKNQSSN